MSNYDKIVQAGGSAFPTEWQAPDGRIARCVGMTLRDYFAGQALSEFANYVFVDKPETFTVVAKHCYAMADAMLAERAK